METLVSTRLDPGVDPIVEADRRGSIMAVIRLGNKDIELPGAGDAVGGGLVPYGVGMEGGDGGGIFMGRGPFRCHGCGGSGQCNGGACSTCGGCGHCGGGAGGGYGGGAALPASLPPAYVAGVTAPQYGMTTSGTPIGLPGPPHIPLGGPAGLNKHTMKNHTHVDLPHPTQHMKIHVKQQPGMSYPKPANKVFIREQSIHAALPYGQPKYDKTECVK